MAIDIERVVTYPTNSDDWIKTVLIGGVLTLLSVLIVPAFFVYGYVVRALRAGIDDAEEVPVFDDWGTLLKEGVIAFVIVIVYQLVPLFVFAVTVGGSLAAIGTGSDAGTGAGIVGLLGGLALFTVLALVFGYVTLIGLANYAHLGTFGSAFDVGVIRSVATDGAYAIPWLYGVGILIAAAVVAGLLNIVPVLGAIVGVFVTFYGQVAAAWVWGRGFGDAMGLDGDADADAGVDPAIA
ncbi:DUF4013 domain-containing protein [Haloplanus natans]|uniref:DUF4013 domain-containing protein n=1 Tax=Haloplanus natans TaxID=376171 RepID=UPI0006776F85|nr:DUF4013 domain-containing protein [Haloplanus natans]